MKEYKFVEFSNGQTYRITIKFDTFGKTHDYILDHHDIFKKIIYPFFETNNVPSNSDYKKLLKLINKNMPHNVTYEKICMYPEPKNVSHDSDHEKRLKLIIQNSLVE